ncbi:hypothetical protein [Syntrophothermus sp.]|uniref:hypothetical protein n=1 Tax=Syntrophothermus sp. TaxID=2736299 RepID=UPI002580270B|nr:hypothetical protein [Syntrophothermus sp.]
MREILPGIIIDPEVRGIIILSTWSVRFLCCVIMGAKQWRAILTVEEKTSLLEAIINAQTQNYLTEEHAARLVKELAFPEEYIVQMFNLFTEVPPVTFTRFQLKYGLKNQDIRQYYETYVKPVYPNAELEDMLNVADSF